MITGEIKPHRPNVSETTTASVMMKISPFFQYLATAIACIKSIGECNVKIKKRGDINRWVMYVICAMDRKRVARKELAI